MLTIARLAERGIFWAAGVCAALMLVAISAFENVLAMGLLLTPILLILSGAVVAFVILRHGDSAGYQVLLVAAPIVFGVTLAMQTLSIRVPIFMLVAWLASAGIAIVLRKWVRLEVWDIARNGAFTQPIWIE